MAIRTSQPTHLVRPLLVFCIGFVLYSILVGGAFYITSKWLPQSTEWRPYLAALPGIALCGIFILLYSYLRHNDELVRQITTTSLATGCVIGLSAHLVSMTRATVGGYAEFSGGSIVVAMALTFVVVSAFLSWKHR
jgi:hypothetical protein